MVSFGQGETILHQSNLILLTFFLCYTSVILSVRLLYQCYQVPIYFDRQPQCHNL